MNDLAIIFDGRPLRTYPLGGPGFRGGTEMMVEVLAHGLAERGHEVHVITPDLPHMEHRGATEFWWPERNHPDIADVVVAVHSLETIGDLSAPLLVMVPNGIDPPLHGRGDAVDAFATFSQNHIDLMCKRMGFDPERCHTVGLGVDLAEYPWPRKAKPIHGRMLFGNDPTRGLWHELDIFDRVRAAIPEASLHVSYGFERQFEMHRWSATALAEIMWECKRRIASTPGVVSLGELDRAGVLREQQECQVHVMPSDPQNVGSQIHGIMQMELAAAGVPLVLSDIEAFPEVFGEAATLLPLPGVPRKYDKAQDVMARVDAQDWADVVVELMKSPKKWQAASKPSRALAERHTWAAVLDRWEALLATLVTRVSDQQEMASAA